ncbi:hypothetical protein KSP39_PZI009509 [Platanthera zijinensis]|uniref:Uncharacterized protein n=1 Tax=Platanthera zijinensis TaxID=2320716 RepID=A0AAP0G802_9ASPA
MGSCVSRPEGCVRRPRNSPTDGKRRHRRRRVIRRRIKSMETIPEVEVEGTIRNSLDHLGYTSPNFQGSIDDVWFDSITVIESDCDDDFQSVLEEDLSLNGVEEAISAFPPSKDGYHGDGNFSFLVPSVCRHHRSQISVESLVENVDHSNKIQPGASLNSSKGSVSHNDVSSLVVDDAGHRDEGEGILDNCGLLPNNCLPCLITTAPTIEKRNPLPLALQTRRKRHR